MPQASILIIEDEPSIAQNLVYALETEHFHTHHLTHGATASDLVKSSHFDLAVLDIGLPDISGLDICRQIRTHSTIPILFLTARNSEIDQILALELGADDYVTKPFSPRTLVAKIRAILRRSSPPSTTSQPSPTPTLPHPCLHHDPDAMTISWNASPLDLTAHEYKLLAAFLSQPGRTFTREQLLYKAWHDPSSAMDRTIDAHIKSIRAKLKSLYPPLADAIQTRRGLGYLYNP